MFSDELIVNSLVGMTIRMTIRADEARLPPDWGHDAEDRHVAEEHADVVGRADAVIERVEAEADAEPEERRERQDAQAEEHLRRLHRLRPGPRGLDDRHARAPFDPRLHAGGEGRVLLLVD